MRRQLEACRQELVESRAQRRDSDVGSGSNEGRRDSEAIQAKQKATEQELRMVSFLVESMSYHFNKRNPFFLWKCQFTICSAWEFFFLYACVLLAAGGVVQTCPESATESAWGASGGTAAAQGGPHTAGEACGHCY